MALRIALLLAAALVLAGCTDADWDQAASFAGLDDAAPQDSAPVPVPVPAPRPVVTASGDDPFCHGVAAHDSTAGAFDAPTQAHVFAQSYSQCLAIFGSGR